MRSTRRSPRPVSASSRRSSARSRGPRTSRSPTSVTSATPAGAAGCPSRSTARSSARSASAGSPRPTTSRWLASVWPRRPEAERLRASHLPASARHGHRRADAGLPLRHDGGRRGQQPRRRCRLGGDRRLRAGRAGRLVDGPHLERGAARSGATRRAVADRARPQPVPQLGGDVGRLGRLRPVGDGRVRRRGSHGRWGVGRRRCRDRSPRRGDELRGLPHPRPALSPLARGRGVGHRLRAADGRPLLRPRRSPTTDGDSPAAFGNRIAETILAETIDDGSNEADGYADADLPAGQPAAGGGRARHRRWSTPTDGSRSSSR